MAISKINTPEQKNRLAEQLPGKLGVIIETKSNQMVNKKTLESMKRTFKGEGLTKTDSHGDLMQKLHA